MSHRLPSNPSHHPPRARVGRRRASIIGLPMLVALAMLAAPSSALDYDASVESAEIFRNMKTGGQYAMTVVYRNTGTETWTAGGPVRLAINPIPDLPTYRWGTSGRLLLAQDVPAGATVALTVQATAPAVAGHFLYHVRMIFESSTAGFGIGEIFDDVVEVNDMTTPVTIVGEDFREGARHWVPAGATVAPRYTAFSPACDLQSLGPGQKIWCELVDPAADAAAQMAQWDETFADLARQGANVVRSGFVGELFEPTVGQFDRRYCDAFGDVLDLAASYGIRTIFSMSAPTRLQSLYDDAFCDGNGPIECTGGTFPTRLKAVILNDEVRQFTIDRVQSFIQECGLLGRPEILSYRLFDEPVVPSHVDRHRDFMIQLWTDYLVETYGSIPNAFTAWGFGGSGTPPYCDAGQTLLCPPTPNQFCVERVGGWGNFAREYRRFVDVAYRDAYAEIVGALDAMPNQTVLMSASFPSHIHYPQSGPSSQQNECEGLGAYAGRGDAAQWADPGWAREVFDYVALNIADWGESTPDWDILRLWIDYARGDKPAVLHEFGRLWLADFEADPSQPAAAKQRAVTLAQIDNAVERHVSGGQFHYYREFEGRNAIFYGAKEKTGAERPVFADFPLIFDSLKQARSGPIDVAPTVLTINPYSHVLLNNAVLDALAAHAAAAEDGVVRVLRAPQTPPD